MTDPVQIGKQLASRAVTYANELTALCIKVYLEETLGPPRCPVEDDNLGRCELQAHQAGWHQHGMYRWL